ncbi:MAG: glycosyltransferase [Cyanobacteriota bacterium]|nr:glycosyltransferase [Cyanobacteriota bacterium]
MKPFRQFRDLPRHQRQLFIGLAIANGLWGAYYLSWRITRTINTDALWISIPLLVVEIYAYFGALMFMVGMGRPRTRNSVSLREMVPPLAVYPDVDIFITHYNEGRAIIEPTVRHCLTLDYPLEKCHIYVLDDGKVPEVAAMAAELGVHYITRPTNLHFKAGNINHALLEAKTFGEFILTLDCDHIPKPYFLQRVLPYFYELNEGQWVPNRVAFVQTPQYFYNLPAEDPFGHRASLFYGPIQKGKDGLGAAFYTGTNALLRREAVVQVALQRLTQEVKRQGLDQALNHYAYEGGLSTTSITEDMETAMNLHAKGWQSVYHHETLAEGLAPEDLQSALKQRLRWAQGTIQVLVKDNPLVKPGLNWGQRLAYFQTMYSYFGGFAVVVYLLCPIIYFLTEIPPVKALNTQFVLHLVPFLVLNRLTFISSSWGIPAKELWRAEQFAVALFPIQIQAVWSVLTGHKIKFEVTSKQRKSGIYLGLIKPQLAFIGLTVGSAVWAGIRLAVGQGSLEAEGYWVNVAWSIYNVALLWAAVRAATWQGASGDGGSLIT